MEHLLVGLAAVVVLGVAAQWLAWRVKVPAIPFLLIAGFIAGSLTGFLDPDALLGDVLFPVVSLSVAIILFEGGLTLNIAELKEIGTVVRNLVTVGLAFTWVTSAVLAHYVLGLGVALSLLLGAILVVTGPTVIGPLLRHIRPSPKVGSAAKWEGIVNDPIGAILAVLVFEAVVVGRFEEGAAVAAVGVAKAAAAGGGAGLLGAGLMVLLIRRYWVPDFLQSPVTLGVVLAAFTASNLIQPESGLLAVTVMGSALASQRLVDIQPILAFKENLRVLLISALFIILAARVPVDSPAFANVGNLVFLAALILVVRPAAVAISTWGSVLSWRERVFLGFLAPRGIVAAAVASLFALEFTEMGDLQGEAIAPITFVVIVGTVGLYGFAAAPLARWLKVAVPNPQGQILVGADPWIRAIANVLQDLRIKVLLVDTNWSHVAAARATGLQAFYGNILSEGVMERLPLGGMGGLLALTPNDEVNSLAALHFRDLFGQAHVFQLVPQSGPTFESLPRHLRGRYLFRDDARYSELRARFEAGGVVKKTPLTEEFDFERFQQHYGESALPLFAVKESGELVVFAAPGKAAPKPGQTLISLVDAEAAKTAEEQAPSLAARPGVRAQ